jgi:hypothetical protein
LTKNALIIGLLVLASALAVQAIWLQNIFTETQSEFSDRVRSALNQTALELFRETGDPSREVPPISQTADNAWLIRFDHHFDYECLPPILTKSLKEQAIEGNYEAGIYNCANDELILGYAGSTNDGAATTVCDTENDPYGCFYLTLMFTDRYVVPFQQPPVKALVIGALLIALLVVALLFWQRRKNSGFTLPEPEHSRLLFGQTELDNRHLTLQVNGNAKTLTYREARLLDFMARRPNELLSREQIVAAVWDDDANLSGRSLDVFMSRLRKLLLEDDLVKIVNVHGVGYRMEVRET